MWASPTSDDTTLLGVSCGEAVALAEEAALEAAAMEGPAGPSIGPTGLVLTTVANGRSLWTFADAGLSVEVQASPGCGLGVFARHKIRAGERVLCEAPLLLWHSPPTGHGARYSTEVLISHVRRLGAEKQEKFYALAQNARYGAEKTPSGIWRTNSLPLTESIDGAASAAIFATVCRINHSCRPNAHHEWNAALGVMTVHALGCIEVGSELTLSYLARSGTVQVQRQSQLQERFGFTCTCALCRLAGNELATSDSRQRRIGDLGMRISASISAQFGGIGAKAHCALVEEKLSLMLDEAMPTTWAMADLYSCAMACKQLGDMRGAYAWASRAAACALLGGGEDTSTYLALRGFLDARPDRV